MSVASLGAEVSWRLRIWVCGSGTGGGDVEEEERWREVSARGIGIGCRVYVDFAEIWRMLWRKKIRLAVVI